MNMSTAKKTLTSCAPKTAVAYARYSSAGQRDVSIDQQLRDIHAFAEREGYVIIHDYADHAKSGFKNIERREQFHAMLAAAESGAFDTVIAWKVDRFGRNRRESASYKGQLADNGVSVIYAMEPIPKGAAGCLTEGMLEAIAEWYSQNLSENTKRGLHDNALKCMANGPICLGYDKGPDGRFVINEDEAAIIRRIFNLYSEGHSLTDIVRTLNNDGLKTKKGYDFRRMTVLKMLANESYKGVYHYGDITIPDGMPAIIDKDLFDACQLQRKNTAKHHGKSPEGYLLSGICRCWRCGSKMYGGYGTSGSGKRYHYYVCSGKRNSHICDNSRILHKEVIEQPVVDFIRNNIMQGDMIDQFLRLVSESESRQKYESPLKLLEKELSDVKRRSDNITRAISEGIWTSQTKEMLDQLTKRAEELEKEIIFYKATEQRELSDERFRFMLEKYASGDLTNYDFLRSLCSTFINSVTVYDHWLRIVFNLKENAELIPLDQLPPIDDLPDATLFDTVNHGNAQFTVLEQYRVAVFKIAI